MVSTCATGGIGSVTFAGLIGGDIWLRSGDKSDPKRAKRPRYVAAEEQTDRTPHASVMRAPYHTTIVSLSPQSLLWWTSMENSFTQKLYTSLHECASTGASFAGKAASDVWRQVVGRVAFSYSRYIDEIILPSLTVR